MVLAMAHGGDCDTPFTVSLQPTEDLEAAEFVSVLLSSAWPWRWHPPSICLLLGRHGRSFTSVLGFHQVGESANAYAAFWEPRLSSCPSNCTVLSALTKPKRQFIMSEAQSRD